MPRLPCTLNEAFCTAKPGAKVLGMTTGCARCHGTVCLSCSLMLPGVKGPVCHSCAPAYGEAAGRAVVSHRRVLSGRGVASQAPKTALDGVSSLLAAPVPPSVARRRVARQEQRRERAPAGVEYSTRFAYAPLAPAVPQDYPEERRRSLYAR